MYTVYKILSKKNDQGLWYEKYDIPNELNVPPECITIDPPEELTCPKFNWAKNEWEEDKDVLIDDLYQENKELHQRVDFNEQALLDAINMLSSMIVGE